MVECELFCRIRFSVWTLVLIDTWWNVNVKEVSQIITNDNVLIDTWWNVNSSSGYRCQSRIFSFNRYMVECEYLIGGNLLGAGTSFNRYMVECEYEKPDGKTIFSEF